MYAAKDGVMLHDADVVMLSFLSLTCSTTERPSLVCAVLVTLAAWETEPPQVPC